MTEKIISPTMTMTQKNAIRQAEAAEVTAATDAAAIAGVETTTYVTPAALAAVLAAKVWTHN